MIRFSAFLVIVAVGLLVAGVVTSKLLLVYVAIGLSGVALLALGIGAAVNWRELTGTPKTAAAGDSEAAPAPAHQAGDPAVSPAAGPPQAPVPATAGAPAAGSSWPAAAPSAPSAPSRAGSLPAEPRPEAPSRDVPPQPAAVHDQPAAVQDQPAAAQDQPAAGRPDKAESAASPGMPEPVSAAIASASPQSEEAEPPEPTEDRAGEHIPASPPEQPSEAGPPSEARPPSEPAQPEQASEAKQAEQASESGPGTPPATANPDPGLEVTVVPGVPRYHDANCILIRFMGEDDLDTMTMAAAKDIGCTPCRACLPDQPDKSPE